MTELELLKENVDILISAVEARLQTDEHVSRQYLLEELIRDLRRAIR